MCMGLDDDLRDVEEHVAEARRIVHRQKGLAGARRQFVKYTEPLCLRRGSQQADACSVPPGRLKACDQPHFDGVTSGREYDWYRGCGGFRRRYGWFAPRRNQNLTSSDASAGRRSYWPSAQRYSTVLQRFW
jgi:hypothetical protein